MQYVFLEIETSVWDKYIIRTTTRQYDNIRFNLEIAPNKLYSLIDRDSIEKHRDEIIVKKLGLRVRDTKSVKIIDKDYIKILIATNQILSYKVGFSIETMCKKDVLICSGISVPYAIAVGAQPFMVVPDKLYKKACDNGFKVITLSEYLKRTKKRYAQLWLSK